MFSDKSKFPIYLGFAAVLGLMLLIVAIGIGRMSANDGRMEQVVNQSNVKTGLIVRMYATVWARSVILLRLLSIEESFERDVESGRLFDEASRLNEAGSTLGAMPLDGREHQDVDLLIALNQRLLPMQTEVVDLIYANRLAQARQLMIQNVIPTQDEVRSHLAVAEARLDVQREQLRETSTFGREHGRRDTVYGGDP